MTDDTALADRLLRCLERREQIAPLSGMASRLSLARAYRISTKVAEARTAAGERRAAAAAAAPAGPRRLSQGDWIARMAPLGLRLVQLRPIGRKIGFTNRTIWTEYNVSAPIFGPMYDTTVRPLGTQAFEISALLEPRIEPEIAFLLASVPEPEMQVEDLMGCVSGICAGFELVQSVFPGWKFEGSDTAAAFGLHGVFLYGPVHDVSARDRQDWVRQLSGFRTTLYRNGEAVDEGHASNVLGGGPLVALGHLVVLLAEMETPAPLAAGEFVTTGTLTRALPVAAGETWRASFDRLPLEPIELNLTDQPV